MPLATVAVDGHLRAASCWARVRLLGVGLREGYHPVHGRVAWQAWTTERLMDLARATLFPFYASLFTPVWLRALGMKVGRRVEISTVLALPSMTTVGDGAFLADDTMVASYELGGGWLRIAAARIGKRAFLGNSGMTAAGREVPNRGLVGVLSVDAEGLQEGPLVPGHAPDAAAQGRRGRRPEPHVRPAAPAGAGQGRGRAVPARAGDLHAWRWPCWCWAGWSTWPRGTASARRWPAAACCCSVPACWPAWSRSRRSGCWSGRFRVTERPLWSSFVWRNELADTFVEVLAVPWLAGAIGGTPLMNLWLRGLGARIGRGVWTETYWLPEADLVRIGAGATVNRGCVVQTHLFHDRIMRMDEVTLDEGATLGPHGIVLPGVAIGAHATIGPASLVMRGETVPAGTRWLGNPIAAWPASRAR